MKRALVVGASAQALERLGLPKDVIETFPLAFKHGISAPEPARALSDCHENDPAHCDWGGP